MTTPRIKQKKTIDDLKTGDVIAGMEVMQVDAIVTYGANVKLGQDWITDYHLSNFLKVLEVETTPDLPGEPGEYRFTTDEDMKGPKPEGALYWDSDSCQWWETILDGGWGSVVTYAVRVTPPKPDLPEGFEFVDDPEYVLQKGDLFCNKGVHKPLWCVVDGIAGDATRDFPFWHIARRTLQTASPSGCLHVEGLKPGARYRVEEEK